MRSEHPNKLFLWNKDCFTQFTETTVEVEDGLWVPARPVRYPSIFERIKLAYDVFVGNADAAYWYKQ